MPAQIDVHALKRKLDAGDAVYLVDVRLGWEHDTAHLPYPQVHVPLAELPHRLDEIDPPAGALVVAYCHHGVRSLSAAALLERAGHQAASLAGGIDAWSMRVDPAVRRY